MLLQIQIEEILQSLSATKEILPNSDLSLAYLQKSIHVAVCLKAFWSKVNLEVTADNDLAM